jgi:microsomal dipeptidase-like Zn-dependent dipeptidase
MSPDTIDDALAVTAAFGISPVVTHGKLQRLHHSDMAFRDDQVLEVYRQGGVFSVGLSPEFLDPVSEQDEVPPGLCPGTVEMFQYHWQSVLDLVLAHSVELVGAPVFELTDAQRTRLAVGWSSDWNGWARHAAPVYGRCRPLSEQAAPTEFDTRGLAHPGLLPQHWQAMERAGADLTPMLRSAERFLQLWEQAGRRADLPEAGWSSQQRYGGSGP